MKPYQIEQKAKEMSISVPIAFSMRRKYLMQVMFEWDDYLDEKTSVIPEFTLFECAEQILEIYSYQKKMKEGFQKDRITDANVSAAKDYPIDRLIEFNRGVALAFCHTDKHPSLSHDRKNNKARCFVCDKSFSSIDVLTERDGMSFIEAVKQLGRMI